MFAAFGRFMNINININISYESKADSGSRKPVEEGKGRVILPGHGRKVAERLRWISEW
jgi:hypothetical protein